MSRLEKIGPEHIEEKRDKLVIDLCTEDVLNKTVYLYRNALTGKTPSTDTNILTPAQFQTKLSRCVKEIIFQKLESCLY